jgi:deoxyribodipyrimidine photo-lyase
VQGEFFREFFMQPFILWYRNDLRLADHAALHAAAAAGAPVIPVYVLDDEAGGRSMGAAARWWLHQSLVSLDESLQRLGSRLILKRGKAAEVLANLATECKAGAVYYGRSYDMYQRRQEAAAMQALDAMQVKTESFNTALLIEPWQVKNQSGGPYKVFTPYWNKGCLPQLATVEPLPSPGRLTVPANWPESDALAAWGLLPTKPDWAGGFRATWKAGEAAAKERLDGFLAGAAKDYKETRNLPGMEATSRLSPYLRFGEISPRQVYAATRAAQAQRPEWGKGYEHFLSELGWREFSYNLLYHFPAFVEENFRQEFDAFPWIEDEAALMRWQQGKTGYPIVDAGMRQLWHTGWMHNRVRMIVASFLIKDLLIHWRAGEAWFWDTLVDADIANNSASWQWVAGCGADAAPYFRIFNPVGQGEKFDPEGNYIRQWVPELAALPKDAIHSPWLASTALLKQAGVELGGNYPYPMVDHAKARDEALRLFQGLPKREEA